MKKIIFSICLFFVFFISFAQNVPAQTPDNNATPENSVNLEAGESKEVIPGLTVTFDSNFTDAEYVPVSRIAFSPSHPELILPRGTSLGALSVILTSLEADTEVRVEVSDSERLIYTGSDEWIPLLRGYLVSVNFTAVGPQAGTIRFFNRNDELVAEIPYRVAEAKQLRQSINGSIGSQADFILSEGDQPYGYAFGLNYSVGHVSDGWSANAGADYDPDEGTLAGSVGASYTW